MFSEFFCEPEVDDDGSDRSRYQAFLIEHDVFQLDIPMHDAFLVEVVQGREEVFDDFFGNVLFEEALRPDKGVESDIELFSDHVN